jgi:hypothetical protein
MLDWVDHGVRSLAFVIMHAALLMRPQNLEASPCLVSLHATTRRARAGYASYSA